MISDAAFSRLLQLDECWQVLAVEYEAEPEPEPFTIVLREKAALWPKRRCPVATCAKEKIVWHDHAETCSWRNLDAFGNPENLTANQKEALPELDLKHLATGEAYIVRLELREFY